MTAAKISVDISEAGCRKPKCKHRMTATHRHHKAHEWQFVRFWAISHKWMSEQRVRDFVCRYFEFRPEDVEKICAWHHAEVHMLYDKIIAKFTIGLKKYHTSELTWDEAHQLMDLLRKEFEEWIKKETKGVSPSLRLGGDLEYD